MAKGQRQLGHRADMLPRDLWPTKATEGNSTEDLATPRDSILFSVVLQNIGIFTYLVFLLSAPLSLPHFLGHDGLC